MIPRRFFIASLIGVCVLSASVCTGVTLLLAEHGPAGSRGAQGFRGLPGPLGAQQTFPSR